MRGPMSHASPTLIRPSPQNDERYRQSGVQVTGEAGSINAISHCSPVCRMPSPRMGNAALDKEEAEAKDALLMLLHISTEELLLAEKADDALLREEIDNVLPELSLLALWLLPLLFDDSLSEDWDDELLDELRIKDDEEEDRELED